MPRYVEEFEVVRQDAYTEGLDILAEVERKASLDSVTWVPTSRNLAVARGGVAERLYEAGFTDEDIKALIGTWARSWLGEQVKTARHLLQIKPQLAVTRNVIRDSQQGKVYQAEARIPEGATIGPVEIERYVAQVMADPWFKLAHPEIDISDIKFKWPTKGRRATCKSEGSVHTLRFPVALRNKKTVIHELAHAATNAKYGRERIAGHGAEFVYVYLRLVYRRFGRVVGFALQNAFIDCKVKSSPRVKPLAQTTEGEPVGAGGAGGGADEAPAAGY